MATAGLDFSICKKLVNQQVRDMTQLVDIVRRIKQIKYEKERNKRFDKKKREKTTTLTSLYLSTVKIRGKT